MLGSTPEGILTITEAKHQKPSLPAMERAAVDTGLRGERIAGFAIEEMAFYQGELEFGGEFRLRHLARLLYRGIEAQCLEFGEGLFTFARITRIPSI